jgi:hypothetical protein
MRPPHTHWVTNFRLPWQEHFHEQAWYVVRECASYARLRAGTGSLNLRERPNTLLALRPHPS